MVALAKKRLRIGPRLIAVAGSRAGVTLVEAVLTAALMLLVLGTAGALYLAVSKSYQRDTSTMEARADAELAMNIFSRDIRQAVLPTEADPQLEQADRNDLVFHTDRDQDGKPERIRYFLRNNKLWRSIQHPSNDSPPWTYQAPLERVISSYTRNSATRPTFRFFASLTEELTPLPLSSASRARVRMVQVELVTDRDPGSPPDELEVESDFALRNFKGE